MHTVCAGTASAPFPLVSMSYELALAHFLGRTPRPVLTRLWRHAICPLKLRARQTLHSAYKIF